MVNYRSSRKRSLKGPVDPCLTPSSFFLAVGGCWLSKLSHSVNARSKLFRSLLVSELFVVRRRRPASVTADLGSVLHRPVEFSLLTT